MNNEKQSAGLVAMRVAADHAKFGMPEVRMGIASRMEEARRAGEPKRMMSAFLNRKKAT